MPTLVLTTPSNPGTASWTDSTLLPGAGVTVQDEGGLILAGTQTLNFTGPGVTAAQTGPSTVAVTIPGGGGAIAVWDQQIFVAAGANAGTADGSVALPFASISAAQATILDAAPGKRYAIVVSAGEYVEVAAFALKPNVFIVGATRSAVRITAPSFGFDATFTGGADNRSGFTDVVLTGASTYDWNAVTSTAGKLYFENVTFNTAVTLTGTNNAIPQATFSGCQFFGNFASQGINILVFNDNIVFGNITLTQSPFGAVPTIFNGVGGYCTGTFTATTTVVDFNRRISGFARSFWMNGPVTVDGASAYLDYTLDSLPTAGITTLNGGNAVLINPSVAGANTSLSNLVFPTAVNNPIIPAATNATNFGDWGTQWFFTFSYVYLSTGTDMYLGTAGTGTGAPDSSGRNVYIQPDQYGLLVNVSGGALDLRTSTTTGTGVSGNVDISTGPSVNGNSGDITLTTGAPSGTGIRGTVEIDSGLKLTLGVLDGTPSPATLRANASFTVVNGVANIALPGMLATDDGLRIEIADTAGVPTTTVTPPAPGIAQTMNDRGGSTWIWVNAQATWYCTSKV